MPLPSSGENYLRLLVISAIVVKFLVNNMKSETALCSFLALHFENMVYVRLQVKHERKLPAYLTPDLYGFPLTGGNPLQSLEL